MKALQTRYHLGKKGFQLFFGTVSIDSEEIDWHFVFKSWHTILQDYVNILSDEKDLPWNYNERPQIGFFAAAIWRLGGAALEEWRTIKRDADSVEGHGRCDLFARLPGVRPDLHMEAKSEMARLDGNACVDVEKSKRFLQSATRDAEALTYAAKGEKVAIAFVCLERGEAPSVAGLHRKLVELRPEAFDASAISWACLSDADLENSCDSWRRIGLLVLVKRF